MLSHFLPVFFSMFIVIDPIGLVPLYIALTSNIDSEKERRQIITKAVCIAFAVSGGFIIAGKHILALLHIEPGSFYIAGGIMLFIISLEMLFGQPTKTKTTQEDEESGAVSVAVFPLAIPMLAGAGTQTTIILYTSSEGAGLAMTAMLFISLIITLACVWLFLRGSELIIKTLGRTGVSVLERIMGILLSGLSVQFVYNGVIKLGILG
ncbi:MAG: MarC family protein [Spirochaetaceae bacterium]|jgi:multiple antibiotic resistance protein|nr:MarC family protein [Spirochaetaceae bacterium]